MKKDYIIILHSYVLITMLVLNRFYVKSKAKFKNNPLSPHILK